MASSARWAGAAVFVGAVQFGIFMVMAEALYPDYSVYGNYISDLGATCDDLCTIFQPSSTVFNASVSLLGVMTLASAYLLWKNSYSKPGSVTVALTGVGALGVGLFPETTGIVHGIFSLVAFLFAGISAVVLAPKQKVPMNYFSAALGAATLISLVLYVSGTYLDLGPGGMERMVVYPVLLWAIGFGGHLMGGGEGPAGQG